MTVATETAEPGWYPDPAARHEFRWFDGTRWTEQVSDHGIAAADPLPAVSDDGPRDSAGVAAFVLALVWLGGIGSLLGVILGSRAQGRARRAGRTDGFAVAGITLGIVGLIGSAIFWFLVAAVAVAGNHTSTVDAQLSPTRNGGVSSVSRNAAHPPQADVTIAGCTLNDSLPGEVTAQITVTNHSSKTSSYFVTVSFTDPNRVQVASSVQAIAALAPGQVARRDAAGFVSSPTPSTMRCTVTDVERLAS